MNEELKQQLKALREDIERDTTLALALVIRAVSKQIDVHKLESDIRTEIAMAMQTGGFSENCLSLVKEVHHGVFELTQHAQKTRSDKAKH